MSFTVADFHDLVRLVTERPEWRADLRRLVLTEELLALPDQVARLRRDTEQGFQQLTTQIAGLTSQVAGLTTALDRTEKRIEALSEAQSRTEEQIKALTQAQDRTEEQIKALIQAQSRTEEELRWLANWQRGEAGRRDGERYERDIIRQAPVLFHGGQGGPPERPDIQQRLTTSLETLLKEDVIEAENNPFLADLLWWKGEQGAVVEVSLQVDRQDVSRAAQRANMLRRSGAAAIAVVIGEQWATPEAREQAQKRHVEWKIDADLSDGFLSFRRQ
jgi:hypothetical protein